MAYIVLTACAIACYTDIRSRKIPNWLTIPLIVIAPLGWGIAGGWHSLLLSLCGVILGMALLIIPAIMGGMGGGDLKLLMAFGALGGPIYVTNVFIYTVIAGGIAAVLLLAKQGELIRMIKEGSLWLWWLLISRGAIKTSVTASKLTMPYALCLAFGAVIALYYPYIYF